MVDMSLKFKSSTFKKVKQMNTLKKRFLFFISAAIFIAVQVQAQVSVIGIQLQHFNVTPTSLLQASIMNSGPEQQVIIESKLFNAANEVLMISRSSVINLKTGINMAVERNAVNVEYGANNQATYIKTSHILPGGRFKICVTILSASGSEVIEDFCDEVDADLTQFLYLVNPPDKDTIPTPNPLLVWTHSEPFSILGQGEYFRMIVVELNKDQQPEEGIVSNVPLFIKTYLTSHELLYPADAKALQAGKRYGWQVQKMSNDIVINKTEAWEFTLAPPKTDNVNKYAILKKKLDAGYYTVYDNKLYFRFIEDYSVNAVKCVIYDSQRNKIQPKVRKDEGKSPVITMKGEGYNRFEIDLNSLNITSGFHTLEVKNEKGELYMLKFLVE